MISRRWPSGSSCLKWATASAGPRTILQKKSTRLIEDRGCLRPQTDGSFARQADAPEVIGAGVFDVHIDQQQFTCLRLFEIEKVASERDIMIEAYIPQAGRTVLFRRYNGNRWAKRDAPPHN